MRRFSDIARAALAAPVLSVTLVACTPQEETPRYVARVDKAQLSERDLRDALGQGAGDPQQTRAYVNEWVVTEILYQEAVRRGITESDEIRKSLEDVRKRLSIAALIEATVDAAVDTAVISDESVASYLRASGEEFTLREDVINASLAVFAGRDVANTFRQTVLGGTAWDTALVRMQADTATAPLLLRAATREYFTRSTLFPEELWKLAGSQRPGDISFVAKTPEGYSVVMTNGIKRPGEQPDFEYVREEVRSRMLMDLRRRTYDRLLDALRKRYPVDVRLPGAADAQRPRPRPAQRSE